MQAGRPLLRTADGSQSGAFAALDWALLSFNSVVWGASFLLIAIGIESLTPGMVAWLRMILGATALAALPASRTPIPRADWGGIAVVAIAGNAGPALLFAVAEQTVESSVAGMLNAAVPLITAAVAFSLGLRSLRSTHVTGLAGGLAGVVLISLPSVTGEGSSPLGIAMVLLAVTGYALMNNVLVPLQHAYGSFSVTMKAQLAGAILLTPVGLWRISDNHWDIEAVIAVVILGVVGTGLARVVMATLVGRVGATRASIVGYLVPVTALALGVAVRSEHVSPLEVIGLAVVLSSAFLVTRSTRLAPRADSRNDRPARRDCAT